MSNVHIKRAVENIRSNTTVYTPVVEMIVNAIQAIDEAGRKDGKVLVRAQRDAQVELDSSLPDVTGFDIEDNGIGFTNAHRDSFDTLYTDVKITEGGKGFGRCDASQILRGPPRQERLPRRHRLQDPQLLDG